MGVDGFHRVFLESPDGLIRTDITEAWDATITLLAKYREAVAEARLILTVPDAMSEEIDSPGNMAWAVLTHALEGANGA